MEYDIHGKIPAGLEEKLIKSGSHKRCKCHNIFPKQLLKCPLCGIFNPDTTVKECPQCQRLLDDAELFKELFEVHYVEPDPEPTPNGDPDPLPLG